MRRLLWSAALLLALLAGCAAQETAGDAVQPVNFYYPRVTPAYGQADGCLAAEVYDWGAQEMDDLALLNRYLQGPVSEELRQPLPEGTAFLGRHRPGPVRQCDGERRLCHALRQRAF